MFFKKYPYVPKKYTHDDVIDLEQHGHEKSVTLDGTEESIISAFGQPSNRWKDEMEICLIYKTPIGEINYVFAYHGRSGQETKPFLWSVDIFFDDRDHV
jgi:hypothetical protein